MRNLSSWSLGVCAFCAALAAAQAPRSDRAADQRTFVPDGGKQSANALSERLGYRAFSDVQDSRSLLAEPTVRRISEAVGDKYDPGRPDARSLGRELRESAPLHNTAFVRPAPGEKANPIPDAAEVHHLTAPSSPRSFRPDHHPVREGYGDRLPQRR